MNKMKLLTLLLVFILLCSTLTSCLGKPYAEESEESETEAETTVPVEPKMEFPTLTAIEKPEDAWYTEYIRSTPLEVDKSAVYTALKKALVYETTMEKYHLDEKQANDVMRKVRDWKNDFDCLPVYPPYLEYTNLIFCVQKYGEGETVLLNFENKDAVSIVSATDGYYEGFRAVALTLKYQYPALVQSLAGTTISYNNLGIITEQVSKQVQYEHSFLVQEGENFPIYKLYEKGSIRRFSDVVPFSTIEAGQKEYANLFHKKRAVILLLNGSYPDFSDLEKQLGDPFLSIPYGPRAGESVCDEWKLNDEVTLIIDYELDVYKNRTINGICLIISGKLHVLLNDRDNYDYCQDMTDMISGIGRNVDEYRVFENTTVAKWNITDQIQYNVVFRNNAPSLDIQLVITLD